MDELLFERVKQLKEIEDRLVRILEPVVIDPIIVAHAIRQGIRELRNDVLQMIAEAERQYAAF